MAVAARADSRWDLRTLYYNFFLTNFAPLHMYSNSDWIFLPLRSSHYKENDTNPICLKHARLQVEVLHVPHAIFSQANVLVTWSQDKTSRESLRTVWEIESLADWATGWVLTVRVDWDGWLISWLDTLDACLAGTKKTIPPDSPMMDECRNATSEITATKSWLF